MSKYLKEGQKANYDKYPVVEVPGWEDACVCGWEAVTSHLAETMYPGDILVVECYQGVHDEEVESVFESLKPYMCESSWIIDTERERVLINTSSSKQAQLAMYDELDQNWPTYEYDWVTCKIDRVDELMGLYGGLFFLGAFLSIAFLTITILNMYFSQLQQGYEDAKRFAIMRKVGLTRKEIKKSINSQIVVVFLLPLLVAVIHTAASYPMVNKILNLLGGCDASSFLLIVLICCLLFAVVYTIAYLFTRRTYLKMVSGAYDGK